MATVANPNDNSAKDLSGAFCVLGLVSLSPLVFLHFINLWQYRPHYEFAPLVVAIAGWLIWRRWPSENAVCDRWTSITSWLIIALGLLLAAAAVVLFSPTVATVALLLAGGGVMLGITGRSFRPLLGPWLLLLLIVPLPSQMDHQLIRTMQWSTATLVSGILDWVGVEHLLSGFVFQLPGRDLFVAEACSGIHSQLVLVVACLVMAVAQRRGLIATLLLVIAGVFWSVAANVTRVTAVVIASAQFNIDLSSGWIHEVLGFGLLAGGVLMLISTDQVLQWFLGEVETDLLISFEGKPSSPPVQIDFFCRLWNRWIAIPADNAENADDTENTEQFSTGLESGEPTRRKHLLPFSVFAATAVTLGLLQCLLIAAPQHELNVEQLTANIQPQWSPETLGPRQREEYFTETRDRSSDEGLHSSVWRYSGQSGKLQCQVDYPFVGWHELPICYRARGSRVVTREIVRNDQNVSHGPFVEVEMEGPTGESGVLLFSLFDSGGRTVDPLATDWTRKLMRNPLFARLSGRGQVSTSNTTIQVQQFVMGRIHDSNRQSLAGTFIEFRDAIHRHWFHRHGVNGRPDDAKESSLP